MMDFINGFFSTLFDVLLVFAGAIWYIFTLVLVVILNAIFSVVLALFQALDFSAFTQSAALAWAGVPPQLVFLINAFSIPQCFTLIGSAILIRMTINLVPAAFTRV